jgi:hypothetical protein
MAYTRECDLHAVMVAVRREGGNTRTDGAHREQHFPTLLGCPVETSRTVFTASNVRGVCIPFTRTLPHSVKCVFEVGKGDTHELGQVEKEVIQRGVGVGAQRLDAESGIMMLQCRIQLVLQYTPRSVPYCVRCRMIGQLASLSYSLSHTVMLWSVWGIDCSDYTPHGSTAWVRTSPVRPQGRIS